jgi:undecaprenyl phosphate-alpha-L-ara4N flippase subunit ArnF
MSRVRSLRMAWTLVAASIVLSAIGQLCMKVGMQAYADSAVLVPAIFWAGFGLFSYAISMVVWLGVLTRLALSYAYPLLSVSYVLVYFGATHWSLIHESATPTRTMGTLLIALGVGLVSLTAARVPSQDPATRE